MHQLLLFDLRYVDNMLIARILCECVSHALPAPLRAHQISRRYAMHFGVKPKIVKPEIINKLNSISMKLSTARSEKFSLPFNFV